MRRRNAAQRNDRDADLEEWERQDRDVPAARAGGAAATPPAGQADDDGPPEKGEKKNPRFSSRNAQYSQ